MKIQFSAWEIEEISATGFVTAFPPKHTIPNSEILEVNTLKELLDARAEYIKTVPDHLCMQIYTRQIGRDRAVSGFKKLNTPTINPEIARV